MAAFLRISKLLEPLPEQEDIQLSRRIVRYLRSELNSVESSFAKLNPADTRQKTVEMLGQFTGEMGHYLDEAAEACSPTAGEISTFDPRQTLRPLWGIFEFKAGQKDISLEILADQEFPETVTGREKVFRGLFVLVLSYILHASKSGGTVRCNLRSGGQCEFQCVTEEQEGISEVEGHVEELLAYLTRVLLKTTGTTLILDEALRSCSFDITSKAAPAEEAPAYIEPREEVVSLEPEQALPEESPLEEAVVSLEQPEPEVVAPEPVPDEFQQEEWKELESAKLRVIIAEDNALSQKYLRRIVEEEGHEAVCVSNGKELIARLENEPFNVCLLDCQMGVLDGYKATGIIRANEARLGRRTNIIGMATHLDVDNEDKCLQAGMDAYLSKPIHKGMLVDLLKRFGK